LSGIELDLEEKLPTAPMPILIGLVKRVHLRDEMFDMETLRVRTENFHVIGRMALPHWYCRTRDRFEMKRPD
jgi:hypothetical protein